MERNLGNVNFYDVNKADYAGTKEITEVYGITRMTLLRWKARYTKDALKWFYYNNNTYFCIEDIENIIKIKNIKR